MKKRFFSLILAFVFITSCTLISYASNGFNKAVFDNAPDVFVSKDEMTGELLAASESLLGDKGTIIPESGDGYVMVYSGVAITDDLNLDTIIFKYRADSWAFVDSVIIKIGNKRYKLENVDISRGTANTGLRGEDITIAINSKTLPMMADLIAHRDEEIKVRLQGEGRSVDFTLTDDVKNGIINIYNLFAAGGGTSKASLKTIDLSSSKLTVTVGQD
jgi:hypothetical protein